MDCNTPGLPVHHHSNSCLLSQWCHPTISSSVILFSSHLQSFPASGSFQMSQFFTSGGQSIGVSVSASVLPMNIQDWFPLGWTGWISLQSKGLSRVFSNTTVIRQDLTNIIGEVNGNSLQYSCLENPIDGGAWEAPVHGVAKSRTRLSHFTHSLTNVIQKKNKKTLHVYKNGKEKLKFPWLFI